MGFDPNSSNPDQSSIDLVTPEKVEASRMQCGKMLYLSFMLSFLKTIQCFSTTYGARATQCAIMTSSKKRAENFLSIDGSDQN